MEINMEGLSAKKLKYVWGPQKRYVGGGGLRKEYVRGPKYAGRDQKNKNM